MSEIPGEQPAQQERVINMTFGQALHLLKLGHMIARAGWNGKGMFLFIRPEFTCDVQQFEKIVSVPDNVKHKIILTKAKDLTGLPLNDVPVKFTAYISMFAADGSIVNGWLASQKDMLANDWEVVE